jgi:hypothetical protein
MQIRIISTPPGEAREQVRSAWVGLTLPLVLRTPSPIETVGVVSKPKTRFGLFLARFFGRTQHETGYVVDASRAIELLSVHAPEAAQWWRQHAPRAVAPGELLLFATEACEEVTP